MELNDYEKKVGHSVEEMSYDELLGYLEINQDKSTAFNLSYKDAFWLEKLYKDNLITSSEYVYGLSVLREAVATSKEFCKCFVEAEDPTGKEKDRWVFYLRD